MRIDGRLCPRICELGHALGVGRSEVRIAVTAVLFAAGAAQAADAVTFVRLMLEHGSAAELNPIVRAGAAELGLLPLVVAKLSLVVLVVAVFTILVRSRTRLAFTVATAATTAGMIGAFSNVLAL